MDLSSGVHRPGSGSGSGSLAAAGPAGTSGSVDDPPAGLDSFTSEPLPVS